MQGLELTSDGVDPANNANQVTGGIVIEGILNPQNYPLNPNDIGWTGLSGLAQGGQPSFAQVASGASVNETRMVSPSPSSSKAPMPTALLMRPSSPSPASVTPRWKG